MMDPFDRVVTALRLRGCLVQLQRAGNVARARCPTHRDLRPSLVVTRRPDRVLVHCFAGCRIGDVVMALGLRVADLFSRHQSRVEPAIIAVYSYCNLDGVVIAEKVRLEPKSFRWRRPADNERGWIPGLAGADVRLYRWPELIDARQVVIVEGEKAVDQLRELGFIATCPPSGANRWIAQWSLDLWRAGCREAVVLPDNDRAGRLHGERVAASCFAVAEASMPSGLRNDPEIGQMLVKLIVLPTASGGDVCDWLADGNDSAALRTEIGAAPYWSPGLAEKMRLERRRLLTRERVRKKRERDREQRRRDTNTGAA